MKAQIKNSIPRWLGSLIVFMSLMTMGHQAKAQLALSTLDPNYIEQGEEKEVMLFGRGLSPELSIAFDDGSGNTSEVTIVDTPELVLAADAQDGRGDRLVFTISAAAGIPLGPRNLNVSDGTEMRSKIGALSIRPGDGAGMGIGMGGMDGMNGMGGMDNDTGRRASLYDDLPPRQPGTINAVTRASPPKAEIGGQFVLWIEGREFPEDVEVKFGTNTIDVALDSQGNPMPIQVIRNTEDSGGEMDGIIYFGRVGLNAPVGDTTISLSSPSIGAPFNKDGLFEIVPEGEGLIFDMTGAEEIGGVTSASPLRVRAGKNIALWTVGIDFNIMSQIGFSNPSIQEIRPSEVVIGAQNAQGYDGIRSYLQIPPTATPGMVNITVTNPNGSEALGVDMFEIFPPSNQGNTVTPGGIGGACTGDDRDQIISEIIGSDPSEVRRGTEVDLKIFARGLACNASFSIYGGGIDVLPTPAPAVYQDQEDPTIRFFQMRIKVSNAAPLGPKGVTIINIDDGMSKSRDDVFSVVAGSGANTGASCQQKERSFPLFFLLFVASYLMLSRSRLVSVSKA